MTYSQIWLNYLMIIVGSSISQNWGKNQKKKKTRRPSKRKKLSYQWNEKECKERDKFVIHRYTFLTNNLCILFSRSFFGSTMGTKRMGRKREREKRSYKSQNHYFWLRLCHICMCACVLNVCDSCVMHVYITFSRSFYGVRIIVMCWVVIFLLSRLHRVKLKLSVHMCRL